MSHISRRDAVKLTATGLALGAGVLLNGQAHGQGPNPWSIEFIPKDAETVSVVINGKVWNPKGGIIGPTWDRRRDGHVNWVLPPEFAGHDRLRIVAVAHPWGRDARIRVFHNKNERKNMEFSKEEDHEIGAR
jgi:hypothetical protein